MIMRGWSALVILMLVTGAPAAAAELASCHDFAKVRDTAGASPYCAPQRIENDTAFDFFKTFKAREISLNY